MPDFLRAWLLVASGRAIEGRCGYIVFRRLGVVFDEFELFELCFDSLDNTSVCLEHWKVNYCARFSLQTLNKSQWTYGTLKLGANMLFHASYQ